MPTSGPQNRCLSLKEGTQNNHTRVRRMLLELQYVFSLAHPLLIYIPQEGVNKAYTFDRINNISPLGDRYMYIYLYIYVCVCIKHWEYKSLETIDVDMR